MGCGGEMCRVQWIGLAGQGTGGLCASPQEMPLATEQESCGTSHVFKDLAEGMQVNSIG